MEAGSRVPFAGLILTLAPCYGVRLSLIDMQREDRGTTYEFLASPASSSSISTI